MDIEYDSDDESVYSRAPSFAPFDDDAISVVSSQTSHAGTQSMRSASPAPSVMSISDSIREMIYKHEYGRSLNNYSDVYRLPADEEELNRLGRVVFPLRRPFDDDPVFIPLFNSDQQHEMMADIMGGKYVPPMAEVMREEPFGEQKACLDLGCGRGTWLVIIDCGIRVQP